ncbi:neugrin [Zerene cesonia]|uniref:neugrin n=1 Tax=Zerene cesonia TaxID=33412 RepID=UPI0018E51125|nr:neugrin [Zerene cesonia]
MFALQTRRMYLICDKMIVRKIRQRRSVGPNPGLDERLRVFRKDGIKVEDNDAEEFIEQSESSFYNVGEAYNEHLNETLIGKHVIRHHIVKEKYFKENMPNLLTWSEKEQIRHLATTMPDEWTPQRIAESFPVTEAVVKKLLKFPWKPATEQRIARHDASAMRNWRELKEGSLDIPEKLRQHFLKFSERTIPPLNQSSIKIDLTQEENMGEFESIIKKCAAYGAKNEHVHEGQKMQGDKANQNHETQKTDKKRLTLDELANKIKNRLEQGQNVDMPDKIIVDSISQVPEPKPDLKRDVELFMSNEKQELTQFKADDNKLEVVSGSNYPERIRIPKKAYRKGATYKVNDCFYDHDGRFLYRVIGLTGKQ